LLIYLHLFNYKTDIKDNGYQRQTSEKERGMYDKFYTRINPITDKNRVRWITYKDGISYSLKQKFDYLLFCSSFIFL